MKTLLLTFFLSILGLNTLYSQFTYPAEGPELLDRINIGRPALTFNGWALNNLSLGYSVQQYIAELTSTDSNNPAIQDAKYFISISNNPSFSSSSDQTDIRMNAFVLESIAYRSLFSYIQLQNPANLNNEINFGEFDDNIEKLREGFALIADPNSQEKFFTNISQNDAFKNSTTLMSMSRAYDYYVSLRMLMAHNVNVDGLTDYRGELPPFSHATAVNNKIIDELYGLYHDTNIKGAHWLFPNVNLDEVQVGNWPIIAKAAIGYAALGISTQLGILPSITAYGDYVDIIFLDEIIKEAIKTTTLDHSDSSNRNHHMAYMLSNGKSFAEGEYYFEVALSRVLPFYHAFRLNHKSTLVGSAFDPIANPTFEYIIEQLADNSTPGARTIPLDDGNTKLIQSSIMLRWDSSYGSPIIGGKFASIYNKLSDEERGNIFNIGGTIAVPKTNTTVALSSHTKSSISDRQFFRYFDHNNKEHLFLLNTEKGNAVGHGEGHEQPDNLQFLYFYENVPVISDAGYDSAPGLDNSTFNGYHFHNLITNGGLGLLNSPFASIRKRMVSNHEGVIAGTTINLSKAVILAGSTNYILESPVGTFDIGSRIDLDGIYNRNIIVAQNTNSSPLVYDLNSILINTESYSNYEMKYIFSKDQSYSSSKVADEWVFSTKLASNENIYLKGQMESLNSDNSALPYTYQDFDHYLLDSDLNDGSMIKTSYTKEGSPSKPEFYDEVAFFSTFYLGNTNATDYVAKRLYDIETTDTQLSNRYYMCQVVDVNNTTKDIIFKRVQNTYYNSTENLKERFFDIEGSLFKVNSGVDVAFTRVVKSNKGWEVDTDYNYNFIDVNTVLTGELFLTSNQTLDGNILIDGEEGFVTVHGATLTIAPGSRVVFVGDRVNLTTSNGGKIIADDVSFINQNSSDNGVSIYDSGSQFTNCSFEGFSTGLGINSNGVLIDQCLFKNNNRAISVSSGRVAAIYNSTFENNTYGVYALGTVLLDGMGTTYTTGNVFKQNTYGIYAFSNGNIFTENGLYESNTTAAIAKFSGVFGVGKYELGNSFRLNTNLMTNESSFTIDASRQYHNGPAPSNIVNLLYQPTISVDPTNPLNTDYLCGLDLPRPVDSICPDDGGGGTNPDPTNPIAKSRNGSDDPTYQVSLQQLHQLLSALYEKPEQLNLEEAMLATFMQFVKHYDQDLQKQSEQFAGFLQYVANQKEPEYLLKKWTLSITNEQQLLASQLYLKLLLLDNQVDQVLRIIDKEARKAQSTTHSLSYLGIKLDIYLRLEDFDQALLIVDQMEALTGKAESRYFASKQASGTNSESTGEGATATEDWSFIRDHITALRGVSKGQTSTKSRVTKEAQEPLITHFVLHPSYPNPFNPVTTISFELPEAAMVTVEVFNMTGQLVATLTNQHYSKGQHSLLFDASNRSTGVYLVRAVMGSEVSTQKITLMK